MTLGSREPWDPAAKAKRTPCWRLHLPVCDGLNVTYLGAGVGALLVEDAIICRPSFVGVMASLVSVGEKVSGSPWTGTPAKALGVELNHHIMSGRMYASCGESDQANLRAMLRQTLQGIQAAPG